MAFGKKFDKNKAKLKEKRKQQNSGDEESGPPAEKQTPVAGAGLCPAGGQVRAAIPPTRRRGLTGETRFPPWFNHEC